MIDKPSYTDLTAREQEEFLKHKDAFTQAVLESGASDSFDFEQQYYLKRIGGLWCLTKPSSREPFAGITVTRPEIVELLLDAALQDFDNRSQI